MDSVKLNGLAMFRPGICSEEEKNTAVEIIWEDTHLADVPLWEGNKEITFTFFPLFYCK